MMKEDAKPSLILIRGLPGSGKSTIASKMIGYKHVEADMYFVKNGVYTFEPNRLQQAHDWCYAQVAKALKAGCKVVIANTFVRRSEVEPYVGLANSLGVGYQVVHASGVWQSIHNVPAVTVERMRDRWETLE